MKKCLVALPLCLVIISLCGCLPGKSKSEERIMEYLKSNYPNYSFKLSLTDGDENGITYWATEEKHTNVSSYITYYPDTGDINENIPVALISNDFEQYIRDKISKSFPNSKIYYNEDNSIDRWNSWEEYEYSLDNYLKYLEQNDVSGKEFTIVLDENNLDAKIDQLHDFYSDIDKFHYISLRLYYVSTEYVDQADTYFTGAGFEADTPFDKSCISDEWIYVWGGKEGRFLHSTEDGNIK